METEKYIQQEVEFAKRELPAKRVDRLEESLYWLFSAATLVCLLLEIIGH